jgi:hypothetical protein
MCNWVHLPDKENALPSTCTKEGEPYCPEHTQLLDYLKRLDWDSKEIEKTHKSVCDEPKERSVSASPIQTSKTVS